MSITLCIILIVAFFILGWAIGRNNPNLATVNELIATGKAIVKAGADGVTQITKKP